MCVCVSPWWHHDLLRAWIFLRAFKDNDDCIDVRVTDTFFGFS